MVRYYKGNQMPNTTQADCEECDGSGEDYHDCPSCHGSGEGRYDGSICQQCHGGGREFYECKACNGSGIILTYDNEGESNA